MRLLIVFFRSPSGTWDDKYLKVVLFERMTSMRMKIYLRLSAAGFLLAMERLFESRHLSSLDGLH